MELREISATTLSPYRCYVRGNIIQTEGENVHTIGFKDGLAVVQYRQPPGKTNTQNHRDKMIDSKAIDLTRLKKIIVKVDPETGKKYIVKDGKRIEILPQVSQVPPLAFNLKSVKVENEEPPKSLIIKKAPSLESIASLFGKPDQVVINKHNSGMKVIDNVKYHVLSMNVKKSQNTTVSTMTDCNWKDKNLQTDSLDRKESSTQTEPSTSSGRDSPFSELFYDFILGSDDRESHDLSPRKMINPAKLKTKEEIIKFNFFNAMRNALNFDRSGNLPIHESVMQNDTKAVQKNCVVLRAIRETVNILNQQGYAPLHLAILHDISVDIINILLGYGADLNVTDAEGNTAIHLAIENGRSNILKVLLGYASESGFNFNVFNYEGFTPLILAVLNQSHSDAKLLLQYGADPNIKDMKSGRTALFHAAESYDVDLVELLMEYKADTKIRNFFGTSAHDAMFEVDDMPVKIKFCILGRDHQRFQSKKNKAEGKGDSAPLKKAKLETTPVLRRVNASEIIKPKRK